MVQYWGLITINECIVDGTSYRPMIDLGHSLVQRSLVSQYDSRYSAKRFATCLQHRHSPLASLDCFRGLGEGSSWTINFVLWVLVLLGVPPSPTLMMKRLFRDVARRCVGHVKGCDPMNVVECFAFVPRSHCIFRDEMACWSPFVAGSRVVESSGRDHQWQKSR